MVGTYGIGVLLPSLSETAAAGLPWSPALVVAPNKFTDGVTTQSHQRWLCRQRPTQRPVVPSPWMNARSPQRWRGQRSDDNTRTSACTLHADGQGMRRTRRGDTHTTRTADGAARSPLLTRGIRLSTLALRSTAERLSTQETDEARVKGKDHKDTEVNPANRDPAGARGIAVEQDVAADEDSHDGARADTRNDSSPLSPSAADQSSASGQPLSSPSVSPRDMSRGHVEEAAEVSLLENSHREDAADVLIEDMVGFSSSERRDGSSSRSSSGDDDDDSEFGEHGWYSAMGAPEADVGSVFDWPGGVHSFETQSVAGHPGNLVLMQGQEGQTEDPQEEEDGTSDSNWSERRKLVEAWEEHDEVWISMRKEAREAAEKEPLLVSFIYSTILNQKSLEASVAFHLANKLAGPNMLSTQVQALVRECFAEVGTPFRRQLRRDIIAVRERDPACDSYHDCLLYFKGFQALQTHRVAHWLFHSGRHALAFYLQSQVNQEFQIDIHPGAEFGAGVFIDHGTGIVVGETAVVGDDVSMLHRVTLGGSGVQCSDRHPKIGNGVLIGAGACLLGNISVGKGTQIGAGSLVVTDLPDRCVAVGVPAKVIGQGRKRKPALAMGQDFFKEVWRGLDI